MAPRSSNDFACCLRATRAHAEIRFRFRRKGETSDLKEAKGLLEELA
jgi:hypothetical protein